MKIYHLLTTVMLMHNFVAAQPTFIWAKQMGGTGGDSSAGIAMDTSGNVYTTGSFSGTADFDPGVGTYNLTTSVGAMFVSKLDTAGNFVWAKSIDRAWSASIALDASGNVYTTGNFSGTADFDPGVGIYNLTSAVGSWDIFVSKLDATGNFIWAKKIAIQSGFGFSLGWFIAVDGSGNVLTTGHFSQTTDFDPGAGVYNLTSTGSYDIFISKLDALGNFVWAKGMGGVSADMGHSIAVDGSGNVYTSGCFIGTVDFDPGAGTYNLTGGVPNAQDIFVSKLDAAGNFVWARGIGGTFTSEDGLSIALDTSGNVYTAGFFGGVVDFDPGVGVYNLTSVGWKNVYVNKLDALGNFVWAKGMGGKADNYSRGIVVDGNGNVFTTGYVDTIGDFDPGPGIYNLTPVGNTDIFVCELDAAGNFICAGRMGGIGAAIGSSIAVNDSGNVFTTGNFDNIADFDPSAGTYNLITTGSSDVLISKLRSCLSTTDVSTNVFCNAQCTATATVNPVGGISPYTYSWNTAPVQTTQTATGLCAGNYTVTVTDAASSTATSTVTITQPTVLTSTATATNSTCGSNNGTASVTAGGGSPSYTYSWNPGGQTTSAITGLGAGNYIATITDANGCDTTLMVTVVSSGSITATAGPNSTLCTGDTITLTATSGTNYSWSTGATTTSITIVPTATATYSVIVSSGTCSDTAFATVTVNPPPSVSAGNNITVCTGTTVTLSASGGITYSWNTGATTTSITDSPIANTIYTVIGTDANGCTAVATVSVTVTPSIIANAGSDGTICVGESVQLNATGGTGYSWVPSTGLSNPNIYNPIASPTSATIYTVIVTSGSCTPASDSVTVMVNLNPTTVAWSNTTITAGNSATLNASGGTTYSWSNGATTSTITVSPSVTTVYCVTVTDNNGCTDSECVTVFVEQTDCSNAGELFIPNAFSPNGDGENDVLKIYYPDLRCIESIKLVIYNRWGEKVFETTDITEGWDGKYKGETMNTAVFVYYMEVIFRAGEEISQKGNVSLIR